MFRASTDQPVSSHNHQVRSPKKGLSRPFIPRPSENFAPLLNLQLQTGGFLQAYPPPYLSNSYPPFSLQQQKQPPLLPLPLPTPHNANNHLLRGLSCPPTNRKINTNPRNSKKPKPLATNGPKKEQNLKPITKVAKKSSYEPVLVTSAKPSGPDPRDLPKDVPKTLTLSFPGNSGSSISSLKAIKEQVDEFSGSVVFTFSPPPSSLPLPTFSLRPKLSCNAEAAGIDDGATDNLRRLLRLR